MFTYKGFKESVIGTYESFIDVMGLAETYLKKTQKSKIGPFLPKS